MADHGHVLDGDVGLGVGSHGQRVRLRILRGGQAVHAGKSAEADEGGQGDGGELDGGLGHDGLLEVSGGSGRMRFVIRWVNYRSMRTRRKPPCDESPESPTQLPISPTNRQRTRLATADAGARNDKARRSGPWSA